MSKIKPLHFFAVISLITILVYLPSINGPFIYDDFTQIVNNQKMQDISNIKDVIYNGHREMRVLQNLSFAVNWAISPEQSWSFKAFNIALHLINGLLLLIILGRLFPKNQLLVYFATALFLLHPLQLQSVTYVMGRISLIQGFFYLFALWAVGLQHKHKDWLIFATIAVSLLGKESCLLIPIVLIAYHLIIEQKRFSEIGKKSLALYISPLLLGFVIYQIFKREDFVYQTSVGFDLYPFVDYIIAQIYYYGFYLFLFIYPFKHSLIHSFPEMNALTYITAVIVITGIVYSIVFAAKNWRKQPALAFLILFFYVSLGPVMSPLQFINPFAEYRLYQSNAVLAVVMGLLLLKLATYLKNEALKPALPVLILVCFAGSTAYLNSVWSSSFDIHQYSQSNYPENARLNGWLARDYEKMGDLTSATKFYESAVKFMGAEDNKTVFYSFKLAVLYFNSKRLDEAEKMLLSIPLGKFRTGRPPLDYYRLKLEIYKRLSKVNEFKETLANAQKHYPEKFQAPPTSN